MARLPAFDIYAELGIASSASRAEIRAAYRLVAKAAHPDVSGPADAPFATARMARINAARDVLLDPDRRAEYDMLHGLLGPSAETRRQRAPTGTQPGRGTAGGAGRRGGRGASAGRPGFAGSGGAAAASEDTPRDTAGRRGPPLGECPVCPWPDPAPFGHCALGHTDRAPRFGGPRRFRLDPTEHGEGGPFASAAVARAHGRACTWFAATRAGGQAPRVPAGWDQDAEFPAVGQIRQRDGVALDPELVATLAAFADEPAVRDALAYAVAGRVVLLALHGDRLRSVVCGRHAYGVEITLGDDATRVPARAACSCPSWRPYCKHILSTWLVWHFVGTASGGA